MLAREERERLLGAMVGVYVEAGTRVDEAAGDGATGILAEAFAGSLGKAEEELVGALRVALETVAAAVSGGAAASATVAALGGAELTTRAVLMAGEAERLPALLPGFAYLVTLPALGEPRAARMAARVRTAIAESGTAGA